MQNFEQGLTQPQPQPKTLNVVGAKYGKPSAALQTYQKEHLLNLSPVQVVQKLYDVAIQGCKKKDYSLAQRALTELTVSLNFEHQEMALGLYRLYDYSKRCIRQGKTDEAIKILEELRSTWSQAFNI